MSLMMRVLCNIKLSFYSQAMCTARMTKKAMQWTCELCGKSDIATENFYKRHKVCIVYVYYT